MQEFKKYISSLKFKGTAQLRQHKVLSSIPFPSRSAFLNLLLKKRNSIGMVPQELLIIKSEIPPDSAESILLSYRISIIFYLSCSQFRGQGFGLTSKQVGS